MKFSTFTLLMTAGFLILQSCMDKSKDQFEALRQDVVDNYADLVLTSYQDALMTAKLLETALETLTENPGEETMAAAKQAWLDAREVYGQTEAYRFYGGPIDDEDGPEGQLNAWPLDESYIDYVAGAVNGDNPADNIGTNIINNIDQFPTINAELIASLNEEGGETNVSAGYHAIEFLLWGQDITVGPGGGNRSFKDYIPGQGSGNEKRRAEYIHAVTDLIIGHLSDLIEEWSANGAYRTFFTSASESNNSLQKILNGIGKLSTGELSAERMFVALDLRSREDEHSCFSDNTHRDIVNNALGIENVYFGRYRKVDGSLFDGPGINDLVAFRNVEMDQQAQSLLSNTSQAVNAIQAPFETEILGTDSAPGRIRVRAGIDALRAQGDMIAAIATEFGFALDPTDI